MILGLDPGTTAAGYAFISGEQAPTLRAAGILAVRAAGPGERLCELHTALVRLMKQWKPEAVAIEKLFFAANAKTAMAVAEARGVLLLTAVLGGTTVYEYTPAEIKKTITGQGNADKRQMQKMLRLALPETRELRARDDVFDALAVALTCHYKEKGRLHLANA
ncbi:MAG: crossover junction endodeoxyribonuclease RuvC [Patescibacteria group bacterium]